MSPALGYAIETPEAQASLANPQRWPLSLLMATVPLQAAPAHYLDPDIGPHALNQDGLGACVPFQAETQKQAQEHKDWGQYLFISGSNTVPRTGAYLAYQWLKHGTPDGSFPGDGIPNSEGSYPEAVWKMAKVYGLPDKNGHLHKISAYYSHDFKDVGDLDFVKQVILAFGPVNFGIPWPPNWMAAPSGPFYRMPTPGGANSGHSITVAGWDDEPDDTWLVCLQTWGEDWTNAQGIYRIKASWLFGPPLGPQIVWKAVDIIDAPTPGGPNVIPIIEKGYQRKVKIAAGVQFYDAATGTIAVVKLTTAATVFSPGAASPTQYLVEISTGGVLQLLRVNKTDVTILSTSVLT